MNGATTIDAALNPASAAADRHTYGLRWMNFSTWGKRFVRLRVGRLTLDVYRSGGRTFAAMGGGANGTARYWSLFTPLGSATWITRKADKATTVNERTPQ